MRSFTAADFPVDEVVAAKRGRRVSVCLPARDEEATVGAIVAAIRRELVEAHGVVDEIVVVDDGSSDRTASVARAAGATEVVAAASVLTAHDTGAGKGQAMWRATYVATGDIVVFCDADVRSWDVSYVCGLVGPLLADDELQLVKAAYDRPLDGREAEGGRVTELMARPVISVLHPRLAPLAQPLVGELAARRDALMTVPFVGGYGVDLGLLIDLSARFGMEALAQCHLGRRLHRNRSLTDLSVEALSVLQVALQRAGVATGGASGGGLPWTTRLERPGSSAVEVTISESPPLAGVTADASGPRAGAPPRSR